ITMQGVRARGLVLDPADVEHSAIEVHLVPAEIAGLGRTQTMSERDQDHGGVPMALTVSLGSIDQGIDLAGCQVLASAKLSIRSTGWSNCSKNLGWYLRRQCRFLQ